MAQPIRVLLADDHAMFRAGLRALLDSEPDMEVVGEAGNGEDALERAAELGPDVVVMDISMPRMSGLDATRVLHERDPNLRIVILTQHAEEVYLFAVLQAGAMGYVMKRSAETDLMEAIRVVHRGEVYLYPKAVRMVLDGVVQKEGTPLQTAALSERELEVLKLTAEGFTNQEIGEKLFLSPKTVDTYRHRIMVKLDLTRRAELVRFALDAGLLTPGSA